MLGANHDVWAVNVEEDYHEEEQSAPGGGYRARRPDPAEARRPVTDVAGEQRGRRQRAVYPASCPAPTGCISTTLPRRAGRHHRSRRHQGAGSATPPTACAAAWSSPPSTTGSTGPLPPPETTPPPAGTPLFSYLVRRLIDCWDLPGGPLTYLNLMNPLYPDGDDRRRAVQQCTAGPGGLAKEWPAVQASLDAGRPCPLGLVKLVSANPLDIGNNHQVLAYGYDLSGTALDWGSTTPTRRAVTMSSSPSSRRPDPTPCA